MPARFQRGALNESNYTHTHTHTHTHTFTHTHRHTHTHIHTHTHTHTHTLTHTHPHTHTHIHTHTHTHSHTLLPSSLLPPLCVSSRWGNKCLQILLAASESLQNRRERITSAISLLGGHPGR